LGTPAIRRLEWVVQPLAQQCNSVDSDRRGRELEFKSPAPAGFTWQALAYIPSE
jgi:hypothetical protein